MKVFFFNTQLLVDTLSATPAHYEILPQNDGIVVEIEEWKMAKATKAGNLISENSRDIAQVA